jgi:hypothetical protein
VIARGAIDDHLSAEAKTVQEKPQASPEPTAEQVFYARILEIGMYVGLACLLLTFVLYVSGAMKPYVPVEDLSTHWKKCVQDYLHDAEIEPGWGWLMMLRYGDFLNFIGIAILAGVTLLCYLSIVPMLLRKRDYIYAVLALLEVIVLMGAASGIISAGH